MKNTSERKILHIDRVNPMPLWNFKQEDDGVLLLEIYKGGQALDVTGQAITLGVKNSKGQLIEHNTGVVINKSSVDITLSNSIFAVKGKLECDLILKDSQGQMSTATFYLLVGQKVLGEENILSTNIIPTIDKIATDLETRGNKLIDDVTKDYCTLQKVIIDENAAADLQNQINGVNSSLDSKAKQVDLEVERKRIDSFTKLEEGSTTGDAELIDARIGADGILYNSLGNATRTQIRSINNVIFSNDELFYELDANAYDIVNGYRISGTDGYTKALIESFSDNLFNKLAIIPVNEGEVYKISGSTFYNIYNSIGLILSPSKWNFETSTSYTRINIIQGNYDIWCGIRENRWSPFNDYEFTIPAGAKYMYVQSFRYCKIKKKVDKITLLDNEFKSKSTEIDSRLDTIEDNLSSNKKIPVICFNFDETSLDRRYEILKQYGLTATFAQNEVNNVMSTLIKNGFDISLYTGKGTRPSDYQDSSSIELWKTCIKNGIDNLEKWGIYNPVMYSCYGHKGGYALDEALKSFNFKYQRCSYGKNQDGTDYYVDPKSKHNDFQQCPILLNDFNSTESTINSINTRIERGDELIMLMMHTFSSDPNVTEERFGSIASYVANLVKQGKCLCLNMRQYYAYYYQEQSKEDDYTRIMSAVIKNSII